MLKSSILRLSNDSYFSEEQIISIFSTEWSSVRAF